MTPGRSVEHVAAIIDAAPAEAAELLGELRDARLDGDETPLGGPVRARMKVQSTLGVEFFCPTPPRSGDPIEIHLLRSRCGSRTALAAATLACRKEHEALVLEFKDWV